MKTNIDSRFVQLMKGTEEIDYDLLTQDIQKDFKIIVYYLAEKLPTNVPFDLGKWEILEFSEDTILIESNDKLWSISLDQVYSYDRKIVVEYRFFTIRE